MQRQENKPKHINLTSDVESIIRAHIGKEWSLDQIQGGLKALICFAGQLFIRSFKMIKKLAVIFTHSYAIRTHI